MNIHKNARLTLARRFELVRGSKQQENQSTCDSAAPNPRAGSQPKAVGQWQIGSRGQLAVGDASRSDPLPPRGSARATVLHFSRR